MVAELPPSMSDKWIAVQHRNLPELVLSALWSLDVSLRSVSNRLFLRIHRGCFVHKYVKASAKEGARLMKAMVLQIRTLN